MPQWQLTNNETGDTLTIEAEREPTQADIDEIFQKHGPQAAAMERSVAPLRGIQLSPYEQELLLGRGRPQTGMEAGTGLTTAVGAELGKAGAAAIDFFTPPRPPTPEQIAAAGLTGKEPPNAPGMGLLETLSTPVSEYLPEGPRKVTRAVVGTLGGTALGDVGKILHTVAPKTKAGQIGAGLEEADTDLAEFFTSPLGAATLGIAKLPRTAQRIVALAFSAQMASDVPGIARELGDELGKPPDQRDNQKLARLTASGLEAVGFSALSAAHGVKPTTKGAPDALQERETAPVLQDVRTQPGGEPEPVPAKEGVEGVQPGGPPPEAPPAGQAPGEVVLKGKIIPLSEKPENIGKRGPLGVASGAEEFEQIKKAWRELYPDIVKVLTAEHGIPRKRAEKLAEEWFATVSKLPPGQLPSERPDVLKAAAPKRGRKLLGANQIADFRPGLDRVERRGERTFVVDTEGQRAAVEVQSDVLTPEAEQRIRSLPPDKIRMARETTERTPYLSPEGRAERLKIFDELQGKKPAAARAPPTPPTPPTERADPLSAEPPNIYGIARRVRDARAAAGQVAYVEPGEGISAEQHVERGRAELTRDPQAGVKALAAFEADPKKAVSDYAFEITRAHGEKLQKAADQAKEKFGLSSEQYQAARKELDDWDTRTRPLQTAWSEAGRAQQGHTDLDTYSFTGISKTVERETGKPMTPEQVTKAEGIVEGQKKAAQETAQSEEKLKKTFKEAGAGPQKPAGQWPPDSMKALLEVASPELIAEMKAAWERSPAERDAYDAVNQVITKWATKLAAAEVKARSELKRAQEEIARIQQEAAQRAGKGAQKVTTREAVRGAKEQAKAGTERAEFERRVAEDERRQIQKIEDLTNKIRRANEARRAKQARRDPVKEAEEDRQLDMLQRRRIQKVQEEANRVRRENAVRAAREEAAQRVKDAKGKQKAAELERQRVQKAQAAVNKFQKDLARRKAAQVRKEEAMSLSERVLSRAREYIEDGPPRDPKDDFGPKRPMENLSDIRARLAIEFGLSLREITALLAKQPRVKYVMDDVWRKKNIQRKLEQQARRWVWQQSIPAYQRFLAGVPRTFFGIKVAGHGMVALGTHAPALAFDPRFWKLYGQAYKDMARMSYSAAFHEQMMSDLTKRGTTVIDPQTGTARKLPGYYDVGRRAGLQTDPSTPDEFADPTLNKWLASGWGQRGYSVLKTLRQDLFDYHYGRLPKELQNQEMARAIARDVNHITGVTEKAAPSWVANLFFAPRLEASRVQWLLGGPGRTIGTGIKALSGKKITPAEKWAAMEQIKSKALIAVTYGGLLAANQGFLSLIGSDQEINFTDPMKSDWLKLKGGGLTVGYGSAMLSMARLPARMGAAILNDSKLNKIVYEDENLAKTIFGYLRTQLSPFAGTMADLGIGRDYAERPLPRAGFGLLEGKTNLPRRLREEGIEPYTWLNWIAETQLPIPVEEAIKEVLENYSGWDADTYKLLGKAIVTSLIMGGTGARVTEDLQPPAPRGAAPMP